MEKGPFAVEVKEKGAGRRLDVFLTEELAGGFSRSFLQKLIAEGAVRVNGAVVKSHYKIRAGDRVAVKIREPKKPSVRPEAIPLDIVYEDKYLLIVNKPAGMVVHPAPGNYAGTLVNALMEHCKDLSGIGGDLKPGIVHRIDKGTSGILLVAKTDLAHRALAKQFKSKTIKRLYVALVKGVVQLDNGTINLPLGRSSYDRRKMAVKFVKSKDAVTHYKVLKRFKKHTLLELSLATGRTHQIRVHLSYIGHPLVGDKEYGKADLLDRPALHAKSLGFIHPATKKAMDFTSELPEDMNELIAKGDL